QPAGPPALHPRRRFLAPRAPGPLKGVPWDGGVIYHHLTRRTSMLTDLQLKKLPKMFALNDNNGDGIIAQEDFEEAARSLASFRGLTPGTSEYEDVYKTVMSRWNHLRETCDTDGDSRVTLKEWLAYWDKVLATKGEYERVGKPFSVVVARTLDLDGD